MNIPGFATKTLLEFNAKVKECLRNDDDNSSAEKDYGVRSFPEWRDEVQLILDQFVVYFLSESGPQTGSAI